MSVEGQKGASQEALFGQRSLEVERSFGEKLGENDRRKGRKTTGKRRENDRRKTGERKLIKEGGKGCKSLTEGRKGKRTALVWTMRAVLFVGCRWLVYGQASRKASG